MDKSDAKKTLRQALIEQRLNLPDRLDRAETLQRVMRIWLVGRPDTVIGAYWPIKGEFDPLPPCTAGRRTASCLMSPLCAALACRW
jgi:5-formyltetrahydrofolate cyclo-ligase